MSRIGKLPIDVPAGVTLTIDGNRVTVKGRDYAYPRYQFSNRSDDIRALFTYACDLVGIEWRPWGRWHISVARSASVARLDEFVGPKV